MKALDICRHWFDTAAARFTARRPFVGSLFSLLILYAARPATGEAFDVGGGWPAFRRGSGNAVAVQGNYAYVVGSSFHVVDISDPLSARRVGGLETPNGEGYGIALSGNYAYVAGGYGGLTVIDISNPTLPKVIAADPALYADFVAVQGGYAYVADEQRGLRIFDISNPATLRQVSIFPGAQGAVGVNVSGPYAYLAIWRKPIQIVDVSNPAAPRGVASLQVAGEPWRIGLSGNHAYVTGYDMGLQVVDVSNPAAPRVTGGSPFSGWSRGVIAVGDTVYVAASSWGGAESFQIFDVSDSTRPRRSGGAHTSGPANGLALAGSFAYLASDVGLEIFDVSDTAQPRFMTSVDLNGDSQALAASGAHVYLADGVAGLQVIDISVPSKPQRVGRYLASGPVTSIAINDRFACVALGQAGVDIVDISDPTQPRLTGNWRKVGENNASTVAILGEHACVLDGDLQILDISDPTKPKQVSTYPTGGTSFHLAFKGSHVFLERADLGWEIVDLSDPAKPARVSVQSTSYISSMKVSGDYLYVTGGEGFQIWNVSSPARPVLLGGYRAIGWAGLGSLAVYGNYVFLAESSEFWRDVLLLDVSDPTQPRLLSRFGTSGSVGIAQDSVSPNAMLVHNGLLLAAQGGFGLGIRPIPGPLAMLSAPRDQRVVYGEGAELGATAFGDSPLGFSWYAGAAGETSQPVADATGPVLRLPDIWEPSSFWVRITNASGILDSQSVTVRPTSALQVIERGAWKRGRQASAYEVSLSGKLACLATGLALEVIDVSDPARLTQVGRISIAGVPLHVSSDANHAYVLTGDRGLRVVDIRDPAKPTEIGSYSTGAVFERIALSGDRAYLAAGADGVLCLDVSNPAAPNLLGRLTTDREAQDVAVKGQDVYAVIDGQLWIIDFSDPANPISVGTFPKRHDTICEGVERILVSGDHACVLRSRGCRFPTPETSELEIFDLAQPDRPRLIGSLETDGALAAVSGIYAFLIGSDGRIDVVDLADPGSPARVGSFAGLAAGGFGSSVLAASGTHLYTDNGSTGLVDLELIPKLQVAAPLLDTNGLTLRWTGGAGTRLQQASTLQNPSWRDVDNSEGQSRIQVPRSAPSQFFRVLQR